MLQLMKQCLWMLVVALTLVIGLAAPRPARACPS